MAGDGSRVPGSSDLELEVELVEWAELGAVPDMERASRLDIGMRKRERGNKHFTRGDYSTAIQCYRCGHCSCVVTDCVRIPSFTGRLPSILTISRLRMTWRFLSTGFCCLKIFKPCWRNESRLSTTWPSPR